MSAVATPSAGRPAFGPGARLVRVLVATCIGVGGLALAAMMLHVCLDIFLREALGIVVPGALEAVSFFYMVACICLAFPIMQVAGEQVVVEVFLQKLSNATLKPFELLGAVLTLLYAAYLCVAAFVGALSATEHGEMQLVGDMDLIIWPSRWITMVGFAIMAIVVLWQLWRIWKNQPDTMTVEPPVSEGGKP
jgi:TRAP-type C4-dicarboxylate transport system permease small subunit